MIANLVSKIAGPKVLVGLILASSVAIGSMGYLLLDAREKAGSAQAMNRQLTQTLRAGEEEKQILRRAMAQRERAVSAVLAERDAALSQTNTIRSQLTEALSNDQCANTDHPAAVLDSLQYHSGNRGRDTD